MPISARLTAARRQLEENGICEPQPLRTTLLSSIIFQTSRSKAAKLRAVLSALFGNERVHLDHDPALRLRKFNPRTGKYTPDANDPNFLRYRTVGSHRIKTFVRGDGAQYSDVVLIKRERRRGKKKKRKHRWGKRKLRSRNIWPKRKLRWQGRSERGF